MARTLRVETSPPYEVHIGQGVLRQAARYAERASKAAVLVDANVAPLYLERLGELPGWPVIEVAAGEASKSFSTLERVLDELVTAGLDRNSCLIALGGGVVGDLCGLAAALFKRGIDFVQCPTTLLAQVDASVGGKTAVNLASGKNLAGTFHQPRAVFIDVSTLASLPDDEYTSGLGEVLKSALLAGEQDLSELEACAVALSRRDPQVLEELVSRSVALKARVVAEDPLECGPRKQLNLGHTFAHAIEHIAGFGRIPHGVAVGAGIGMALHYARTLDVLEDQALPERVHKLARALQLPFSRSDLKSRYGIDFPDAEMLASMGSDKKNVGEEVRLVLPKRAGEMALDVVLTKF